jgi:hypothetical protein
VRSRERAPTDDPAQQKRKESGSQPLEVNDGLDPHIVEAAAGGARRPRQVLASPEAFRTPAMALVEPSILFAPCWHGDGRAAKRDNHH